MQAAGRAGRDAAQAAASEMWMQTWHPTHPLYAALRAHDFAAFAAGQLAERRALGLPPFTHLALLRAEARRRPRSRRPSWPPPPRCRRARGHHAATRRCRRRWRAWPDVERMQLLVESRVAAAAAAMAGRLAAAAARAARQRHKGLLRWAVDVDPLGF